MRPSCGQRLASRDERITERWNTPRRSIRSVGQRAALLNLSADEAIPSHHCTLSNDDIEFRVRCRRHH